MMRTGMKGLLGFVCLVAAALPAACDDDSLISDLAGGDAGTDAGDAAPIEDASTDTITPANDGSTKPDADAGGDAGPSNCSPDGFCWTGVPKGQAIKGIWSDGAGNAFAATLQGNVLRYDGTSWSTAFTAGSGAMNAVWASSATDVWAGGDVGLVHGHGATPDTLEWTVVAFDPKIPVLSIAGSGANDVWAVGGRIDYSTFPATVQGMVKHFTGQATETPEDAWVMDPISYRPGSMKRVIVRNGGDDVWIAGDTNGRSPAAPAFVLHRVDQGNGTMGFSEITSPPIDSSDLFNLVTGAGFVGGEVRILGYTASYRVDAIWRGIPTADPTVFTWTQEKTPSSVDWHYGVWGTAANDVYLAGDFGRFRRFDGTSWSLVRISIDGLPVTNTFYSMYATPAGNELWVAGADVAIYKKFSE